MCGRDLFTSPPEAVARTFGVDVREYFPPRWNVAPTQPAAVIRRTETGARGFALMRWGFIPGWARKDWHERMGSKPLINARAETAAEKPTFRNAWRRRRCLAPADGFYEWRTENGVRQPYCITAHDRTLFGFAALWETAHDPDGGEIDTVAILTTAAGPDLRALHHRAPVVIAPGDFELWLNADERDAGALGALMRPQPEGWWTHYPVSRAVSNARNEGAHLAEPIGQGDLF